MQEIRKGSFKTVNKDRIGKKRSSGKPEKETIWLGPLTKKRFSEIRGLANLIYDYCSDMKDPIHNPIQDINTKNFPFRESGSSKVKARAFTKEEEQLLFNWCEEQLNDTRKKALYPLAIQFNLYLGLRFAEMTGLLWSNIDWNQQTLLVCRQRVITTEMDDDLNFKGKGRNDVKHQKQHVEPHAIFIPDTAIAILKKIKDLGLSDEYVFPQGYFRYNTYNDKVKEATAAAGVSPEMARTHCIRATMATDLYQLTGGDIMQVQYQMRHTTSLQFSITYI